MDKRKILFADDDPEIREVVRILLESEGYQVVEAENGEQAASAADDTFDLIILDVMMPGRNGFSACAEIRRKLNTPICSSRPAPRTPTRPWDLGRSG